MDGKNIAKVCHNKEQKEKIFCWLIYLGCFGFFFFLAYNVPYCHDEWQWGLPERVELMKNGFQDYNGRYLGNILALLITRSVWLKAGILGLFSLWLFHVMGRGIIKKGAKEGRTFFLLLCAFLLLSLPKTLFCQSYGWPAAFVNFVPPVVFFLLYYNLTEQTYWIDKPHYTRAEAAAVLPLGFAAQLFCEHITVFAAAYALWMVILCGVRFKRIYGIYINYLLGTFAGALLMFSNGAYHNAAAGEDGYKHISLSFGTLLEQFRTKLWDDLVLNNWVLNLLLAAAVLYLLGKREKNRILSAFLGVILCGYSTYSVYHRLNPAWQFVGRETVNEWIQVLLALVFAAGISLGIWRSMDKQRRLSTVVLYLCAFAVAAPLLAADPIGSRCFFVSYVFQCAVLLKLLWEILKGKKELFLPAVCILTAVLAVCVIYLRMFDIVGAQDRYRSQLIETAVESGQKEIILPLLPYSDYYWTTVPANETWEKRFKAFYNIPQDVTLKFQ